MQGFIDTLVAIDAQLANTAITQATDAVAAATLSNKDQKKVDKLFEKITENLEEAQEEIDEGDFDEAIKEYKKAWKNAQKIIKIAT